MGISSEMPVKNKVFNETYTPAMYATVKRNSAKQSSSSAGMDEKIQRVSIIGIEAPYMKILFNRAYGNCHYTVFRMPLVLSQQPETFLRYRRAVAAAAAAAS